jgi:3',5'-cyclic AMP phosphodiesterase CpdA
MRPEVGAGARAFPPHLLSAALAALLLAGCSADQGGPFVSDPYVQDVRATSAVVALADTSERALVLEWSEARGGVTRTVVEAKATKLHALRAEGLTPDTEYVYRLRTEKGRLAGESTFRTAPLAGTREVTFVAFGDSGATSVKRAFFERLFGADEHGPGKEEALGKAILASDPQPDFILHTGDVVYPDGSRKYYREGFFRPFRKLIDHVPVFPTMGNHDAESPGGWLSAFTTPANNDEASERYYSFDWGDLHCVALDVETTEFGPGTPQREFLEQDLAASDAKWKIVFFHEPPFSFGRHGSNLHVQTDLVPVFERYGVDLVLSGHDHLYERLAPKNGVTYVVTGGGGAPLYDIKAGAAVAFGRAVHHFVRGRADAARLTLEAIDLDGRVFDSVTLEKPPAATGR